MPLIFRKLASYIRQQHIGLLALFVALGGSAYAAATINSQKVVDNSLTGNDIRGRDASRGKPFTEGSLTGQDIRGSVAGPGHAAVDGSLTGADIRDHTLTGNDIAGGSITGASIFNKSITGVNIADGSLTGSQIADNSIGGGKIADNSLTGAKIDESSLGTVPSASNSAQLGGLAPGVYGTAMRSGSQPSSGCASATANIECAPVVVQVPPGRSYDAIVWSSISAFQSDSSAKSVKFCPYISPQATCLNGSGAFEDAFSMSNTYSESAATFGTTQGLGHLGPGLYTFSTLMKVSFGSGSLGSDASQQVHTTVLLFDAAVPELPVDPPSSGGSSGTSSGGSSGTSSGGSSGTTSGGSSGTTGG